MRQYRISIQAAALAAVVAFSQSACNDLVDVENPNVINEDDLDLAAEGDLLANSALQEFAAAYGWMALHTALFTDEAWTGDTDYYENSVNLRSIQASAINVPSRITTELQPISKTIALSDRVLTALASTPNADSNMNVAKAYFASGFALIWMGEKFCAGVINAGPELTSEAVLDSAISRLTKARTVAQAAAQTLTGTARQQALDMADAALVGIARAHLQNERLAQAATVADQVPNGFVFNLKYAQITGSSDTRSTNLPYLYSYHTRSSYSVAPPFRNLGDPRVPVRSPADHGIRAFDGVTELWLQAKWTALNSPMRLASKLEADYIAAEARGTATMLAMIQARRAAVGQPVYTGATDSQSVLVEFMNQRSREFFMEAKRLGDWRRHPNAISNIRAPGSAYHKSGYGVIGDQTCLILPLLETGNNPNF